MRKLILIPIFGILFSITQTQAQTQQEQVEKIQSYFEKSQSEFPIEKAYLQLDKYTFTLGEDLWFSAFLTAGGLQLPSPLSKTLYVDFFDGDGLLLSQKVIKMENGRGAGDFQIPLFGKTGIYQIKAYTTWMRNFGEDYLFSQTFKVVDGQGGSFLPNVAFTQISSQNGRIRYQVEMEAVDASGIPLSNRTLLLRAISGMDELNTQEVTLNAQGKVSFGFSIPDGEYPDQSLEINFQENPDYTVTHKIKLPFSFSKADIQFLPEGGHWVLGKKSTLAFRAIYPDGTPVEIEGSLEGVDNSHFSTFFGGMGKLEVTPTTEENFALVKDRKTGEERRIALPRVEKEGITLQVVNSKDAAFVTAFIQGNSNPGRLMLVSHTRGLINFIIQGELFNGVWGVRIPKQNLPSGINSISILNSLGKPLLERQVFIQGEDRLQVELSNSGKTGPREKNTLNFTSNFQGKPAPGSFSISVVDADQTADETDEKGNILSALLLTSDLKGKVFNPGHYFKNQEESTLQALDLVMLTHGWSRYSWDDIFESKFPDQGFFIEQGITIQGQISEQNSTKKGLAGGKVSALIGEGVELISTEFGADGKFILADLDYQDSVTVTITAEDQRVKNFIDVSLTQPVPAFKSLGGMFPESVFWPKGLAESAQARNLMQRMNTEESITDLEGVTVEAQTLQEEQIQSRKLFGEGDASIQPDEIPGMAGFSNVFQMIQGRVAGVRVNVSGFNVSVQIRGAGSIQAGTDPLYLLDNVPVDAGVLFQVNPRDIQSIEVFKDPARTVMFGVQGANGVIAVYTKTGAGITYESVGGTLVTKYGGYQIPKEFYSPKYDELTPSNSITDQRATIYWNPLVQTDSEGKAIVEYYNSDIAKKQLIILEGMDAQGRLGRVVKILE
ncbi:hypothetical protein D0X99_07935 [Algoriphagus lacus]|uniref:TonB-dependent receptor plug domain-containing protein n=1 Tax=Algoriphagus lacus TaxID=2056311 RepID=A0A418PT77_9BACT|nr:TonB-dependent receptor plug domain-containing protein [Algoriphagus lacus]RIW16286.1 hypothetical protein D0X99_07935 [Algoriphagus lacus]